LACTRHPRAHPPPPSHPPTSTLQPPPQIKAISADNEFYAIWSALGFTRAPLYTGVTWKAQNQAAVLLAAGQKGHRYTFPHSKISTAPPIMNRVFGTTVDAQLQSNELEYATKYYAGAGGGAGGARGEEELGVGEETGLEAPAAEGANGARAFSSVSC
jgi:hypothetical protein